MSYFVGCPDCKRKIGLERDGMFRCEVCAKTIPEKDARITFTLTAKFQDPTDSMLISIMGEHGDAFVGMSAADFRNMREVQMASPDQLRDIMNHPNFSYHTVTYRAKVDDYNGGN